MVGTLVEHTGPLLYLIVIATDDKVNLIATVVVAKRRGVVGKAWGILRVRYL